MDKLIEKLVGILAKLGLSEEQVNEVVTELTAEENPAPVGDPAPDQPSEGDVPPADPAQVDEGDGKSQSEEPNPNEAASVKEGETVVPPSEGDVPPGEGEPVAPAEPVVPDVPPFDPAPLLAEMEEMKKANEGLLSRIAALEEALKNAGVIDESSQVNQVGDENPSAAPQNPTNDVFGDVLKEINGKKRF